MGKKNRPVPQQKGKNALDRIQARMERDNDVRQQFAADFLLQAGADAFILAAHDVFQLGAGRAKAALNAYRNWINQLMDALIEGSRDTDANGKPDLTYFWTDLDRRLLQIVGQDNFCPKDQRYDETGQRLFTELFARYEARREEAAMLQRMHEKIGGGGK